MFDKNDFKEKFRIWSELNPEASCEEAKILCEMLIPKFEKEKYFWLEEQSLAWFLWKKEVAKRYNLRQLYESEIEDDEYSSTNNIKLM